MQIYGIYKWEPIYRKFFVEPAKEMIKNDLRYVGARCVTYY